MKDIVLKAPQGPQYPEQALHQLRARMLIRCPALKRTRWLRNLERKIGDYKRKFSRNLKIF